MNENTILEINNCINELDKYLKVSNYTDKSTLKYLSDYYRLNISNNKCVFEAELPSYNNKYMSIRNHTSILNLSSKFDVNSYIIRDLIEPFVEFSYLHGYKNNGSTNEIVDLEDYAKHESRNLLQKCNQLILDEGYTTQQVYVSLKLISKIDYYTQRVNEDKMYLIIQSIIELVSSLFDTFEPKSKMEWNKFGSSLKFTYDELHHEALKESERQKIIRQFKNGEINST